MQYVDYKRLLSLFFFNTQNTHAEVPAYIY